MAGAVAALLTVPLAAWLAWRGGPSALLGIVLAAAAVAGALRLPKRSTQAQVEANSGDDAFDAAPTPEAQRAAAAAIAAAAQPSVGGRLGAEVMVSQVVPVWSRQMGVTRDAADEGLGNILQNFSNISSSLESLVNHIDGFALRAEPGAVDIAVRAEAPALERLVSASQRAFDQRDEVVAELGRCADSLAELQQLAKQTRELARHTRLVAFNASIEANRNRHDGDGGSQAVSSEIRVIASRMAQAGEQIERVVLAMASSIRKARRDGEIAVTAPDELRLEIDLRAREAVTSMLSAMGGALQGSSEVRKASADLREHIDQAFINFQFGDRVSQMLSIITNDMSNFARWVAANPRATQSDAADWLARLESSYTMEEQRSHHHGNVHVERGTAVEFF